MWVIVVDHSAHPVSVWPCATWDTVRRCLPRIVARFGHPDPTAALDGVAEGPCQAEWVHETSHCYVTVHNEPVGY